MCMHQVEGMAGRTAAGLPQVSKPADKKAASTPAWNIHSASTKVPHSSSHSLFALRTTHIVKGGAYRCMYYLRHMMVMVCSSSWQHYEMWVWGRNENETRSRACSAQR